MANQEGDPGPALTEAQAKIDTAIREFVDLVHTDRTYTARFGTNHAPYIPAWIIAYEWTTIDFERSGLSGRSVIAMDGQLVSTSLGLAHAAAIAYEPR